MRKSKDETKWWQYALILLCSALFGVIAGLVYNSAQQ